MADIEKVSIGSEVYDICDAQARQDLEGKQDELHAGYGIDISKNEITLPAGYTLLEYVESNGTQFVDTGVIYNSGDNTKVTYQTCEFKQYTGDQYVYGAFTDGMSHPTDIPNAVFAYKFGGSNNFHLSGCTTSNTETSQPVYDLGIHTVEIREQVKPFIDDTQIYYGFPLKLNNTYGPLPTAGTVVLFGCHRNSVTEPEITDVVSDMPYRIYEFEIEGKCHLVPAKNPDGTVGFYDTVRKQFITTDRGDAFVAGKELLDNVISCTVAGGGNPMTGVEITDGFVLPEEFQAVEYIQNTGTEIIQVPRDYILKSDSFTLEFDFRDVGSTGSAGSLIGTKKSNNEFYRIDRGASTGSFILTEDGNGGGGVGIRGTFVNSQHGGGPDFNNLPKRRIDQGSNVDGYWDFVNVIGNRYISFNGHNVGAFGLFGRIEHVEPQTLYYPSVAKYRIYRYIQRDEYGNITVFMIPVKRTIDNVVGMYDFVSKQFCTSVFYGQNTLIAGPEKDYHNGVSAGSAIYYDKNFTTSISGGKVFVRVNVENGLVLSKRETYSNVTDTLYEKSSSTGTGGQAHQKSYQTVIGYGALGGKDGATAYGSDAHATGYFDTAIGRLSSASGGYALTVGTSTNASGSEAIAIGHNATATGAEGFAIGPNAQAGTYYGMAVGNGATANSGSYNIALGQSASVTAQESIAIGHSAKSTALQSFALGAHSEAPSQYNIAIGNYAVISDNCDYSIQLGTGTCTSANKFMVWDWELLDKTTGLIPAARIDFPETATALSELTDVSLSSLANGQSLVYNNGVWSNAKAGVDVSYDATHKRLKFA